MRLRRAVARPTPRHTPSSHARRRPAPPPLLFRGWRVVAGAFLVLMTGYGAAYSYAASAAELEDAFGASHASVSMVYAIYGCAAFAVSGVSRRFSLVSDTDAFPDPASMYPLHNRLSYPIPSGRDVMEARRSRRSRVGLDEVQEPVR